MHVLHDDVAQLEPDLRRRSRYEEHDVGRHFGLIGQHLDWKRRRRQRHFVDEQAIFVAAQRVAIHDAEVLDPQFDFEFQPFGLKWRNGISDVLQPQSVDVEQQFADALLDADRDVRRRFLDRRWGIAD